MARSSPPPGLIYIRDTAAGPGIATRLGVTPGTIRKWRCAGRGPDTFRIGGRVVAHIAVVEAYAAHGEGRSRRPAVA